MGNWTKQIFLKRRNSNGQKTHEKMLTISSHKGNAYLIHTKIPPHPVRIAITKNTTTTGVGEDEGKKEPSYTVGGNVN
jgi:hypothetical protein